MKFYEGKKIEVHTICEDCKQEIIWYKIFAESGNKNGLFTVHVIPTEENVSSAKIYILEERENEIDVKVSFYCKLCGDLNEFTGTIYKENGELKFREQI